MTDNPSSLHKKLVPEYCTRNLGPCHAHRHTQKLIL